MIDKLDFKKEYKDLYLPKDKPVFIQVPPMKFIMVDGRGDPNGEDYHTAVGLLYALSFTIKMSKMSGNQPQGYFDYVVPPLEGLWDGDGSGFDLEKRDSWSWTSMIRQPDFVTQEVFDWACGQTAKKKPELNVSKVRLASYDEGACVQIMHVGPYSSEPASIDKIKQFIDINNLIDTCGGERRHHEIYLSDPRKTAPKRIKTVLRHPVRQK